MFARRQAELKQRQLALRLRNIELRAALRAEVQGMARPAAWLGVGGAAALAALALRRPGRLLQVVGLMKAGLRLARLFRSTRPSA